MTIAIPPKQATALEAHAVRAYPEEACGFLVGSEGEPRTVTEVRPVENVEATLRSQRYTIDPKEILHVERELSASDLILLGFYHSHPDHPAVPSARDTERAWPWYTYLILSIQSGKPGGLRAWRLDDGERVFKEEAIMKRGAGEAQR